MEIQPGDELTATSEMLGLDLDSWNRLRSTEQLLGFIARREAAIADLAEDP